MSPALAAATNPAHRGQGAWVSAALTFQGLKALGVPQESLDSFPTEFQEGMAARAAELGDVGESSPENWERAALAHLSEVHSGLSALSPDAPRPEAVLKRARDAYHELPGIEVIWREGQDCYQLPNERTSFGFKDGISNPAIEGTGIPGGNSKEASIKAGEFVLCYPNELGSLTDMPQPEMLGKNGTYVVFRMLHTRVAAFRQYVHDQASSQVEEERLAAKIVGRWPSGAPLALAPGSGRPRAGWPPWTPERASAKNGLTGHASPLTATAARRENSYPCNHSDLLEQSRRSARLCRPARCNWTCTRGVRLDGDGGRGSPDRATGHVSRGGLVQMLSVEENTYLTRTGPGTPMGELFRRFWLPLFLSSELPENDGPPLRRAS